MSEENFAKQFLLAIHKESETARELIEHAMQCKGLVIMYTDVEGKLQIGMVAAPNKIAIGANIEEYLASGADDSMCMIYYFGSGDEVTVNVIPNKEKIRDRKEELIDAIYQTFVEVMENG